MAIIGRPNGRKRPRQSDHRSARGRRRGRPGGPADRVYDGDHRAATSPRSIPAAGRSTRLASTARLSRPRSPPTGGRRAFRRRCHGGAHRRRRGRRSCQAQRSRSSSSPQGDTSAYEADAAALWNSGLGQPWSVSASRSRHRGRRCSADVLPEKSLRVRAYQRGGLRRVAPSSAAPNVGKSSLPTNSPGSERVVADEMAGHHATRSTNIELGGQDCGDLSTLRASGVGAPDPAAPTSTASPV